MPVSVLVAAVQFTVDGPVRLATCCPPSSGPVLRRQLEAVQHRGRVPEPRGPLCQRIHILVLLLAAACPANRHPLPRGTVLRPHLPGHGTVAVSKLLPLSPSLGCLHFLHHRD